MKKITALILSIILLLSFASCGKKPIDETTTETTTQAITEEPANVEKLLYNQSKGLALAFMFTDNVDSLNNDYVLWNAIGWYVAINSKENKLKYLTSEELIQIQYLFRPDTLPIEPDEKNAGWIIKDEIEEKNAIYRFDGYINSFDEYYSTVDFIVSHTTDGDNVIVTVTVKNDNFGYEESFSFTYKKSDAVYSYRLENIVMPEKNNTDDSSEAEFTLYDLEQANKVTTLLGEYKTIKVEQYFKGKLDVVSNLWLMGNDRMIAKKILSPEYGEGEEYQYALNDVFMSYIDNHYVGYVLADTQAMDVMRTGINDNYIFGYFTYGNIVNVSENKENYTFNVSYSYIDEDGLGKDDISSYYEISKKDLSLRYAKWNIGTEYESEIKFYYDCPIDKYGFADKWEEIQYKSVTINCVEMSDPERNGTIEFGVPYNVEIIPYDNNQYTIYANKEMTNEYSYMGDGVPYEVTITNAMG